MKIFVSVVSYRDPLLASTIKNLLETKSARHDVTVGVFEQTALSESLIVTNPELLQDPRIKYKRIDPEYADGVSWARNINAMQVDDEDFFYQIDSHMQFDKDWDRYLVNDWKLGRAKHDSDKIIITANCMNFDLDEEGNIVLHTIAYPITCKVLYFTYQSHDIPAAHGEHRQASTELQPAIHICAGNFFTHTKWIKDVGIDPNMYFDGEEHMLVLRSFAAGYKMYHPRSIHCYHYIKTHEYVTKPWFKPVISNEKYGRSVEKSRKYWQQFLNDIDEAVLEAYYEYSGVDYINKRLDERAMTHQIKIATADDKNT